MNPSTVKGHDVVAPATTEAERTIATRISVALVCGARPNFMKIAPLVEALRGQVQIDVLLVHTGQHYDDRMSRRFFDDLSLPEPDVNLEVGSGSHACQTAEIMRRFEKVCFEHRPDWVVVVGDVNSTLACALVSVKLGIRVAHVEAGLRSFDRSMPEEINRVVTDAVSDLLFVTEPSGVDNLRREGVEAGKIHLVGNVMIDTLIQHRQRADRSTILARLDLEPRGYAVATLHRPANVDAVETFREVLEALVEIGRDLPVVLPLHPRARENVRRMQLTNMVEGPGLRAIHPLGYLDFVKLMAEATLVLTDSGGIQEETTVLGVPCLTLRTNTERPITVTQGTNRLAGCTRESILEAYRKTVADPPVATIPAHWDGRAAGRIVAVLSGAFP